MRARKVGQKFAVGRGDRGQCFGCRIPWKNGQRMTAIAWSPDRIDWFCDSCISQMRPPPIGVEKAVEATLFDTPGAEGGS